jgi:hypothetical protein
MIEYIAVYNKGSKPRATKRITTDSNEVVDTPISFEFADEVASFSDEAVYDHLNNLVQYIKDTSVNISPVGLTELPPDDGWHLKGGWAEIEWAKEESFKWWNYIYYRDEERFITPEEEQAILDQQNGGE